MGSLRALMHGAAWLAAGLAAGCGDGGPDDPPDEPEPTPLQVSCTDGYSFRSVAQLEQPGHWVAVATRAGPGESVAVTRDAGATWDRLPRYATGTPIGVGDSVLLRGWTSTPDDPRLAAIDADLAVVEPSFGSDPSGRLPPGSAVATVSDDLWIGVTLEGWHRYSSDRGQTWRGSTIAFQGVVESGDDIVQRVATRGDRALIVSATPPGLGHDDEVLRYSTDGGHTWTGLEIGVAALAVTPLDDLRFGLVGDDGIALVAGTSPRELWLSPDHGETWNDVPGAASDHIGFGPGPGELWVLGADGRVSHTEDHGRTWSAHQLVAGDTPIVTTALSGMVVDAAGQPVFHVRVREPEVTNDLFCTVVPGMGELRLLEPERSDAPGQQRLWAEGGLVPMPEPGVPGTIEGSFVPEAHGFVDAILHVERNADGDLMLLLMPADGVDREAGPPMEVWQLDGRDASTVIARHEWNNLRERRGALNNPFPYYLTAGHFQPLPDGSIRIHAQNGGGNFELTQAAGEQVGYPGYRGRWGDAGGGHAYVVAGAPGQTFAYGVLERQRAPAPLSCLGDSAGQEDCYVFTAGGVRDFAVHDDAVWVLDRLNGALWRHDIDGRVGTWQKVAAGLLDPTQLWTTMDPADPGIYVLDTAVWWRIVPGQGVVRRSP